MPCNSPEIKGVIKAVIDRSSLPEIARKNFRWTFWGPPDVEGSVLYYKSYWGVNLGYQVRGRRITGRLTMIAQDHPQVISAVEGTQLDFEPVPDFEKEGAEKEGFESNQEVIEKRCVAEARWKILYPRHRCVVDIDVLEVFGFWRPFWRLFLSRRGRDFERLIPADGFDIHTAISRR